MAALIMRGHVVIFKSDPKMSTTLFPKGREDFADGAIDWNTNTIKCALLDLTTNDTAVGAITGATNATPIVITQTSHGYTTGDIVIIFSVGGNTAANNTWKITTVNSNSYSLQSVLDGTTSSVGNGAYTSGGRAVCIGPSAAGDYWDDFNGCVLGTPQTLTTPTLTNGVLDADDPSFTSVTGNAAQAFAIYKDTGTASTSRMIYICDGKFMAIANTTAASSATSIFVEPLLAPIPSGTTIIFSNGASATLSALASAGDRVLTVSALAASVAAGSYGVFTATGANLPTAALSATNVSVAFPNTTNRIATI